jgi:hypothetical protein
MRLLLLGLTLLAIIATPASACGTAARGNNAAGIPMRSAAVPKLLAASLDQELPRAKLPEPDLTFVKELRVQIDQLAVAGREKDARQLEERAMAILGFEKLWLRCGEGSFAWVRRRHAPGS